MRHIQTFYRRFRTQEQRLQYLFDLRYPVAKCPKCGRKNAYHKHPTKPCYTCNCGKSHIYPQKGTLFERSPVSLAKWFYALFLMTSFPQGVSAKELERRLDVAYPTAWRMATRIRALLEDMRTRKEQVNFETVLKRAAFMEHLKKK